MHQTPPDPALREALDGIKTPGLVVAIHDRAGIIWHHARGHADARGEVAVDLDALFCIGSVTKPFTAQAILILRDEGKLSLDEPLYRSVPEAAKLRYPTQDSPPISLRHLLTHTSGLPRGVRDLRGELGREPDESELLQHLAAMALARAPGVHEEYSNIAFALLGIVVERCSDRPFRDFVAERIFAPLRMTNAALAPDTLPERLATPHRDLDGIWAPGQPTPDGAYVAVGGLYASARDLSRFTSFQLDAWPPRDDPENGFLRRATVRESHRVGGHQSVGRRAKGLGWALMKDSVLGEVVYHNGAVPCGYEAYTAFEPALGIGVVALANAVSNFDRSILELLGRYAVGCGLVQARHR